MTTQEGSPFSSRRWFLVVHKVFTRISQFPLVLDSLSLFFIWAFKRSSTVTFVQRRTSPDKNDWNSQRKSSRVVACSAISSHIFNLGKTTIVHPRLMSNATKKWTPHMIFKSSCSHCANTDNLQKVQCCIFRAYLLFVTCIRNLHGCGRRPR